MKRLLYALFIAVVLVGLISSCKKPKTTSVTPPPAGALVVRSNVHIVDSTQWILHGDIGNGNFNFTFTPSTPNVDVQPGDIIVGVTNGGYINRVRNVAINAGAVELTTSPASMADVFLRGQFTLQVPMNDTAQSSTGVSRSLTNFGFYQGSNGFSISLNGSFYVQPTVNLTFAFDSVKGLTNFQMTANNTPIYDSVGVSINGQEQYNWSRDTTLTTLNYNSVNWITAYGNIQVPLVMKFALSFIIHGIGGSPDYGPINASSYVTWVSKGTFSGGLQYTSNQWQPIYGSNVTNIESLADTAYNADINSNIAFITQISSSFYSVAGPQLTFGMRGNDYGTDRFAPGFSSSTTLWNIQSDGQVQYPIFGANILAFNQSWTSDSIFYQTPYKLFLVSGNGQSGNVALPLPSPLVVQVNDSRGNPVSGVSVHFVASTGSGYFGNQIGGPTSEILVTDQTGTAQIIWTLGAQQGTNAQSVIAWAQDGNQVNFSGSPVTFTATGH